MDVIKLIWHYRIAFLIILCIEQFLSSKHLIRFNVPLLC